MTEIKEMLLLAKANPFCVFPFFRWDLKTHKVLE